MPIDASIPLGVRSVQTENPVNAMARVLQIQGLQQDQQRGRMQMDEYQRGISDKNRMQQLLSQTYAKPEEREDALLRGGFVDQATKLATDRRANMKTDAETDEKKFKLATERHNYFKQTVGALSQEPNLTKDMVLQAGQALVQQGILPAEMYQQSLSNMPNDPAQLRATLQQALKSQMTPEQIFTVFAPKAEKVDNGQQIGFRDTNPNSPTYGQNTAGGAVQKVATPDATLSAQTSTANNQRTVGASYANAAATREIANATRDAAKIKDTRDIEMKLADDYRAQSKNFKEVVDASNRVKSALPSATKSAASTLAAATSFMKMLDPGSVVRESELGMALAATGALDRVGNYFQVLQSGKVLTPSQVKDFNDVTEKVLLAAKQGQQAVDGNYRGQAKQYGLRPEMIIQDLGQDRQQAPVQASPKAPAAGTVQAGYRFKGGDPADQKNWEKQ